MSNQLTNEQKLIIFLNRVTFDEKVNKQSICADVDLERINWFDFFKMALYHKTFTLCWNNISKLDLKVNIPSYLQLILTYTMNAIKEQNNLYLSELNNVVSKLSEENVTVIPVKGSMLIPIIYGQNGTRFMGDMDCLVSYTDLKILDELMNSMGYIQGNYNVKNNSINKISRLEEIKWKTSMSNLFPYRKLTGNINHPVFKFDFRYSLDDSLEKDTVNAIINKYKVSGLVTPAHILSHLCTHFYDEAKHSVSIFVSKDMNLIKLCDIREYILRYTKSTDLEEALSFCFANDLNKQFYYTFFFLEFIYNDGYEKEFLEKLNIVDETFINTFGDSTLTNGNIFKKSIYERIFSCGNIEELPVRPKYFYE